MMKNSFRRLLGLVLAVIMIVGALPVMAMAEEPAAQTSSVTVSVVDTNGKAIAGASVDVHWNGAYLETITTGSDGTVTYTTSKELVNSADNIYFTLAGNTYNYAWGEASSISAVPGSNCSGDRVLWFDSHPFTASVTITVAAQPVTVQYVADGAVLASVTGLPGEAVTLTTPEVPAKEHHDAEWSAELPAVFPDEDLTITAVYTEHGKTTVKFVVDGEVVATETNYVGEAVTLTTPADPSKDGYTFTGWSAELPATFPETDLTIEAQFEAVVAEEESATITVNVVDTNDQPASGIAVQLWENVNGTGGFRPLAVVTTNASGVAEYTTTKDLSGSGAAVYATLVDTELTLVSSTAVSGTNSGISGAMLFPTAHAFTGSFNIVIEAEETPDTTAPVISLTNNKTVCVGTEFTVTDDVEVAEVRVNSAVVTAKNGKFSVGEKIGTITIYAKDTAGNETTVTVKVAHHNWSAGVYSCSKYTCAHHKCPGLFKCNYKACTTKCYTSTCHDHARGYCYITYTCTRCSETKPDFYKHYSCYNHDHSVQPELNKKDHVAYVEGYGKGLFKPENDVTRAEVATILYRLMTTCTRDHYKTTDNDFYDVGATNWFNTAVSTLDHAGIITDSDNGWFRPNEAITRAELAVMLAQFSTAKYTGASTFTDVDNKHWAAREIAIVQDLGWIEGYPDNTFQPDDTLTRAEMVTMINRVLQRAVTEKGMLKNMTTFCDVTADKWYYEDVLEAANGHFYNRTKDKVSGQTYFYEDWTRLF